MGTFAKSWIKVTACAVAGAAACMAVQAQTPTPLFAKPEDAVAYRKGVFNVMERHFSRLNNMALGRLPYDGQAAALDADTIVRLSRLPYPAFVPGSEQVGNTRANEFVWKATPRFQQDAEAFFQKADALPAAARAGDLAALKKAMTETGASCRKCHEQFRTR